MRFDPCGEMGIGAFRIIARFAFWHRLPGPGTVFTKAQKQRDKDGRRK